MIKVSRRGPFARVGIDEAHVLMMRVVDIVVRSEYDFVLSDDELFRLSHSTVVCTSSGTRSVVPPHKLDGH